MVVVSAVVVVVGAVVSAVVVGTVVGMVMGTVVGVVVGVVVGAVVGTVVVVVGSQSVSRGSTSKVRVSDQLLHSPASFPALTLHCQLYKLLLLI